MDSSDSSAKCHVLNVLCVQATDITVILYRVVSATANGVFKVRVAQGILVCCIVNSLIFLYGTKLKISKEMGE